MVDDHYPQNLTQTSREQDLTLVPERKRTQYYVEELGDGIGMDMILVPGGTFMMGSPEEEQGRESDEKQHSVTVPRFYMGRYPVTQDQWQQVAGMQDVERSLKPDPFHFKGNTHPVEQVSWDDAVEFCRRLSVHTKRPYRLPSEAEWEYACRAGTMTPFYFGDIISTDIVNYNGDDMYGDSPKGEFRNTTTPVDHFPYANAFGLSDMHGNVWEWCEDDYHRNYDETPIDGSAFIAEPRGDRRILRGGSWFDNPLICRSAYRYSYSPDNRNINIGLRVVVSAPGLSSS